MKSFIDKSSDVKLSTFNYRLFHEEFSAIVRTNTEHSEHCLSLQFNPAVVLCLITFDHGS